MIQILLKDSAGITIRTINNLNELSVVLNDQMIMAQHSLPRLLSYLMSNHYRTKINGMDYYLSNVSIGMNQPIIIVYTELSIPQQTKQLKLVLEDLSGAILFEKEMGLNELALILNDQKITTIVNEAELEFYLFLHHMRITIDGKPYKHKGVSWGINQLPTYTFVKL